MMNITFMQNTANQYGGAVHADSAVVVDIKSSSFISNSAHWGGAFYYYLDAFTFKHNTRRLVADLASVNSTKLQVGLDSNVLIQSFPQRR